LSANVGRAGSRFPFHVGVRHRRQLENCQNTSDVEKGAQRRTMRSFFRHECETRSLTARSVAAATFAFYVADPSALFTCLRAGYGAAGDIALMTKQVASWCETVGSGPVCDE